MKKLSFSVLFLALSILPFLLAVQGCDKKLPYIPEPEVIHVQGITLSAPSTELSVDDDAKLTFSITPSNASDQKVRFTSDNPLVVEVDQQGYIWAHSAGTATITVTTNDGGKTASVTITVKEKTVSVTGIEIQDSQTVHNMVVGDPMFLRVIVSPQDATNQNFTAESSDPDVLTIDRIEKKDGYYAVYLNALKGGNATVTVTTEDGGHTASAEVKVNEFIAITSMTVSPSSLNMEVGDIATLTAIIEPDNATAKYVSWTTSDPAVAAIQSIGYLTVNIVANGPGTATITATSVDNSTTATCVITVVEDKVSVTGIEYTNGTNFSVPEGRTARLLVRVLPENATNKNFTIHIADPSVLEVDHIQNDNGIYLRGLKVGKTNVTVTTEDGGHTATTEVTVTEFITLTSVSFDRDNVTIKVGEYTDLTIIKEPANATDPGSTLFNSDDRDVVVPGIVGSKLRLWAQKPGTATVTLSYAGSDVPPATCVVTVVENQ